MLPSHNWLGQAHDGTKTRHTSYYHISEDIFKEFLRNYGWNLNILMDNDGCRMKYVDDTGRQIVVSMEVTGEIDEDEDGDSYVSLSINLHAYVVEPLVKYPEHVTPPFLLLPN